MKTRRRYLIGIVVVGGLVLLFRYWQFDPPKKTSDNTTTTTLEPRQTASSSHGPRLSDEEERRRANLKKLRALWDDQIQAYDKNRVITEAQKALAAESVRLLSCTDQLAELIEYLEAGSKKHYGRERFVLLIRGNVIGLLLSSGSSVARQHLIEMRSHPNLKQRWVFEASKHCSDDQFKEFSQALGDPKFAQAAAFGRILNMAANDPKRALASTLAELEKGNRTSFWSVDDVIRDVAMSIPLTADFNSLEASLPPDSSNAAVKRARAELLARWCSVDPAAAANHVMQNPERISPESIRIVIGPYFGQDLPGAVEWVQDFPDGEYKDHALTAAVDRIVYWYPAEAKDLAMGCDLLVM